MTPRQKEAADLFAQGLTWDQIGERMGTTAGTAREYLKRAGLIKAQVQSHAPRDYWTEARVEQLRELIGQGKSVGDAANVIGCTRNQAMGKAQRLGLKLALPPGYDATKRRVPRLRPTPRPQVKVFTLPPESQHGEVIPFMDVKGHHCKWVVGDPGAPDAGYCGAHKRDQSSYCGEHHVIAWRPAPKHKPKAARA